ncbi:MAG: hypothetical protein LQ337_000980 [Flavoplaca oasis]|nr:MAG: hypothetical protein LQ337_000980 [Flavoplaca oasis]
MTSTFCPAPSNLIVPSTQNTAPVLSYNCLYTHDLRRKAKRWQDGFLKYHTFNKRIMVYDVPRNFIGDTHWRKPQPIQDGDELELEKGVLIQVGEEVKIERTETDLTELLEKRKPKPTCDGPRLPLPAAVPTATTPHLNHIAHASPETSVSAQISQLRPKTLNALLGRPKGPVGRATLPAKSPAEERRGKETHHRDSARSPKRRKIQHPPAMSPTSSVPTCKLGNAVSRTITGPTTSNPQPIAKPPSRHVSKVISQAPSESLQHYEAAIQPREDDRSNKQQNSGDHHQPNRHSPIDVEIIGESCSDHTPAKQSRRKAKKQEQTSAQIRSRGQKDASDPVEKSQGPSDRVLQGHRSMREDSSPSFGNFEDEPRPENRLRIALSKPRRKLMYRDLLPRKAPSQYNNRSGPSSRLSSTSLDKKAEPSLTAFHQAQQDRLDVRRSKRKDTKGLIENGAVEPLLSLREDEGEDLYTPDKSPAALESKVLDSLFITQPLQEEPPRKPSNPRLDQPKDPPEMENPYLQAQSPQENNIEQNPHCPDNSPCDRLSNAAIPDPPSQSKDRPPDTEDTMTSTQARTTLTKMDSLLLRHPTVPSDRLEVSPPEPKIQPTGQTITHPHPPQPQPRTGTIRAAMPPQPLPRPFQRSTSDLTTPTNPTATTKRRSSGLLKSYSNGFTPLNVIKPPQPHAPIHPTSHGLTLSTRLEDKTTELIPDSRPGSAREQTVDPWSREAYDLFGFDGMEKRVGTGDGGGGEKAGGSLVRGEDGWLVASQGFV